MAEYSLSPKQLKKTLEKLLNTLLNNSVLSRPELIRTLLWQALNS